MFSGFRTLAAVEMVVYYAAGVSKVEVGAFLSGVSAGVGSLVLAGVEL